MLPLSYKSILISILIPNYREYNYFSRTLIRIVSRIVFNFVNIYRNEHLILYALSFFISLHLRQFVMVETILFRCPFFIFGISTKRNCKAQGTTKTEFIPNKIN